MAQDNRKAKPEIKSKTTIKDDLVKMGDMVSSYRKNPLLIMYYPDDSGRITQLDYSHLYHKHLRPNINSKEPVEELDVLLHTLGGHPNSAYLIIQTIRKFAKKINFLIPQQAYSGGTLMAFGSNKVLMGPYASLGPIDIQIFGGQFPLLSIQKYVEFVRFVRDSFISCGNPDCKDHNPKGGIYQDAVKGMILELTKEFPPSRIGQFFNLRKLSEYYGKILLNEYMLKNDENRKIKIEKIINRLNSDHPAHDFDIDYEIAFGMGLKVQLMDPELFDMTDMLIYMCNSCKKEGEICEFFPRDKLEDKNSDYRVPYFRLHLPKNKKEVNENAKK